MGGSNISKWCYEKMVLRKQGRYEYGGPSNSKDSKNLTVPTSYSLVQMNLFSSSSSQSAFLSLSKLFFFLQWLLRWKSQRPPSPTPNLNSSTIFFLSFRGLNTRKTFSDHLYHALNRAGFRTFRDHNGVERSENINSELQKAIKYSKMSVIVFSEDYVSSNACLFEVHTILEQCKKSDHFILPVFYDVDPERVKEQATDLEEKELTEKAKGWSAALKEVASMAGMVLRNQADG
ncbi:hypothetical protein Acr_00g0037730 [Actinidia rufa]|uniref:ADP-ribosyl cyclase/cyclic ADP-ribose hydrolase n=1 Tax=Actinidia rufa TaxID=165716 RepID=A0A7J0DIV1_9ERIC|nr:hypothetical protein Acr_00g0037730 [Actinidia rufa]